MLTFAMIHKSGRRGTGLDGAIFAKQISRVWMGWSLGC